MINLNIRDGIAVITWDMEHPKNGLNSDTGQEFLNAINRALETQSVKGIIITSAAPAFQIGVDIETLIRLPDAKHVMKFCSLWHQLHRTIETGGKPVVAAINGSAIGGDYELYLCCHHRIASNDPDVRIGFPEIKFGLTPGGGGTQRLPRMIGLHAAANILLKGRLFDPKTALDKGLVDAVVPAGNLMDAAREWLTGENVTFLKPWDRDGFTIPGGDVWSKSGMQTFTTGNALLHGATKGNYPAHQAIMSCLYEGLQVPFEVGLRIESRWFASVLLGDVAKNMIRTFFFHFNDAERVAGRPEGISVANFKKIGIIGAGTMGTGIAHAAITAGLDVILLDTKLDQANHGKKHCGSLLTEQVKRKVVSEKEGRDALNRLTPTTDFADFSDAELVIEAVFEDRNIKADVTLKAEATTNSTTVFASNTSTLPITSLAKSSGRPANFIGLHFFSPVHRMKLVEIIRGKQTSDACLASAIDFVKVIGKTPIVVNDGRGFYTSRVFGTYVQEGMAMLAEGIAPALIENAGRLAGMPLGPLEVADAVSLELIYNVSLQTQADLGDDYLAPPGAQVLTKMVKELGRPGKKTGKGFFDYPTGAPKQLWFGLNEQFPQNPASEQPDVELLKKRLLYIQAIDATRCLEERVVTTPAAADIGSVMGWGFAPYTGGVLSMIDTIGVRAFVTECDILVKKFGERFSPPKLLVERARNAQPFYPAM